MSTKKENKLNLEKNMPTSVEQLPKDAQKKYKKLQDKLEKFKNKILARFEDYITGIALLPPVKDSKNKINVLVLIDDTDSKKMSKDELRSKLSKIILEMAESLDKNLNPEIFLLSELWQSCYDGKTEILKTIALSPIIYEKGMLSAIKVAETHKNMVLKKFEKYIVAYVLAGSLVQGKATPESDVDVFIVIDDTDVKKMTRFELRDKLRAIIIGMAGQARELTGTKNPFQIQVYILTDFWDYIKEATPVIFTFLRDGIPFYDRGIFMPWKQLLKMGRIKPSQESIDLFMHSGEQLLDRVKFKLNEIGMEDTYQSILNPSQAALMMYGVPPPTPKETPSLMRDIFVKKEKILEDKYVKILEENIRVRKDLEHGSKKSISGSELDALIKNARDYLKKIKKLFEKIGNIKEEESLLTTYTDVISVSRDLLKAEGFKGRLSEQQVIEKFKEELVHHGKLPDRLSKYLGELVKIKNKKTHTRLDKNKFGKKSRQFIKSVVEYIQRKQQRSFESSKIRIKHGKNIGEIFFLEKDVFFIKTTGDKKKVSKLNLTTKEFKLMRENDFEKVLDKNPVQGVPKVNDDIFKLIKKFFGNKAEIIS